MYLNSSRATRAWPITGEMERRDASIRLPGSLRRLRKGSWGTRPMMLG